MKYNVIQEREGSFSLWLALLFFTATFSVLDVIPAQQTFFAYGFIGLVAFLTTRGSVQIAFISLLTSFLLTAWTTPLVMGGLVAPGLNVGSLTALFGIIVYCVRFATLKRIRGLRPRAISYLFLLFVICSISVQYRGLGLSVGVFGSYLRLICVILWAYRAGVASSPFALTLTGLGASLASLILAISIAQSLMLGSSVSMQDLSLARSSGLLDPNFTLVSLGLYLGFAAEFIKNRSFNKYARICVLALVLISVSVVFFAGSRTATLAIAIGVVVWSYFAGRKAFFCSIGMGIVSICLVWGLMADTQKERFLGSAEGFEDGRLPFFKNAYLAFLEQPYIGGGRFCYLEEVNGKLWGGSHNTMLGLLAEGGVIYGGLFLILLLLLFKYSFKIVSSPSKNIGVILLCTLTVFVVSSNGLGFSQYDICGTILISSCCLIFGYIERNVRYKPVAIAGGVR